MDKLIVYTDMENIECTVTPSENKRRMTGVTIRPRTAVQAYQMERVIKHILDALDGGDVTYEWAESEQQFLERISQKDVPSGARNVRFVDRAEYDEDQAQAVKVAQAKAPGRRRE